MAQNINQVFRQLGRTEKTQFIEAHLELASEQAIAEYVELYPLGVARYISKDTLVAMLKAKNETEGNNDTAGN